ncbi:hypothetical protein B0675_02150 [Streptomyces sp. M41(2017)]|uniref:hypothetical protein n=1 Tax=Streptomyces sp. M41(2017) TaxID=1955065 RepID=UPI0009BD0B4F|nr:hypothetical protein [Streptomyces sp. M41(2017)]OQQ16109.1 hypothetical protein B0675_02150 [Streptomyces sp. M41(2017)]
MIPPEATAGESLAYVSGPGGQWHEVGYATVELVPDLSLGGEQHAEDERAFQGWPPRGLRQSLTAVLSDGARRMFRDLAEELHRCQRRRVRRLAYELHIPIDEASRSFDAVQRVLEANGVGDGYGCLTIAQPVRPPIVWEGL